MRREGLSREDPGTRKARLGNHLVVNGNRERALPLLGGEINQERTVEPEARHLRDGLAAQKIMSGPPSNQKQERNHHEDDSKDFQACASGKWGGCGPPERVSHPPLSA